MANELLEYLLSLTLASSIGILAALPIRRPARYVFGSSACYSLWLLVPVAMLAALLPHVSSPVSINWRIESVSALSHALGPSSLAIGYSLKTAPSIDWQALALSVWCTGATLLAAYLTLQQRTFVKSLGRLSGSRSVLRTARPDGCPALLGVLRPKIILPSDFRSRYTRLERLLIFSHERTHLRRGDAACNGFVALMRCVFWFNPLVHHASSYFRVDQEFACDAAVMRDYPASRRTYAGAMLKTQLAELVLPIGCHWRSAQGLRQRVQMLKRRVPSRRRRRCGGAIAALLSLVVGCTTWVTQPSVSGPKSSSPITLAQSPVTSSVEIDADEAHVTSGQLMELQGNGRLVVGSGVTIEIGADNLGLGVSRDPTKGQNLQGHVRITVTSPADFEGQILQGHVRMTTTSPADGQTHWQAMILQTDRAVLSRQPDGSLVVQFDKGTVQQVPAAGDLTSPLSLTAPETPHLLSPNFVDADLAQVAEAVGLATHRAFIIDPRVHLRVTMFNATPITPEAFYGAFLAFLRAHGLAALPSGDTNIAVLGTRPVAVAGDVIWIVPAGSAR